MSTYNEILSGLCKQGFVEQAMQIMDQMETVGFRPYTASYYQVAKGLWTLGDLTKAVDLLSQMLKRA
jgi:pentatricopeptide repeat protein